MPMKTGASSKALPSPAWMLLATRYSPVSTISMFFRSGPGVCAPG